MRDRIICLVLVLIFIISAGTVQVNAIEARVPERLDGTEKDFEFYLKTADLISDYWEDDYFDFLTYSENDGAGMVDGEWYLSVKSFCKDAGINYKRSGKSFTISDDDFSWECKVNKKAAVIDGEEYIFDNKPLKLNGSYMISAEELDRNSYFEIQEDESGLTVTRPYQMKRLIVETGGKKISPKSYGAVKYVKNGNVYVLQFDSEKDTKAAYEKLSALKKIKTVEPDRYISMIEPYSVLTGGGVSDLLTEIDLYSYPAVSGYQTDWNVSMLGADILAEKIREKGMDSSVTVAIVDTGIDYTHSYISSNIVSKGYDFINNDYDAYDDNGHGTHVAGIVKNVVQGLDVKLLPVKVLSGQGSGSSLSVGNGIVYAAESGADIINLSLGGASYGSGHYEDQCIEKAISLGSTVVVAAGNDSSDTAYECPAHNTSAIVVAAIDSSEQRAYFSNYGNSVDVSAPGVDIYSSVPGEKYEAWSGTSMATPHVSGLAALVKKLYPNASCSKIESILRECSLDLGSNGFDVYYGYGVPYVGNLAAGDFGGITEIPTIAPTVAPTSVPTQSPTAAPTAVPTYYPTYYPTYVPTANPTVTPTSKPTVAPTENPFPDWPTWMPTTTPTKTPTTTPTKTPTTAPTKTPTKTPTMTPTSTPVITQPYYYGDTSCSLNVSSGSNNGKGWIQVNVSTGTGIWKVTVSLSDNRYYEYENKGSGISQSLNFNGSAGLSVTVKAYDYNGYVVSSSTGSC